MTAFMIRHNGSRVCTSGIGSSGVLSTILNWAGTRPDPGRIQLHIGGLDSTTNTHYTWPAPDLSVGDTITIEIAEASKVDPSSEASDVGRFAGRQWLQYVLPGILNVLLLCWGLAYHPRPRGSWDALLLLGIVFVSLIFVYGIYLRAALHHIKFNIRKRTGRANGA